MYRSFYVETVEQAWLMLVDDPCGICGTVAQRPESAHQLEQAPVLPVDLEQSVTTVASPPDRGFAIVRIVFGMAATTALPAESPDFQHSLTVYHFRRHHG